MLTVLMDRAMLLQIVLVQDSLDHLAASFDQCAIQVHDASKNLGLVMIYTL